MYEHSCCSRLHRAVPRAYCCSYDTCHRTPAATTVQSSYDIVSQVMSLWALNHYHPVWYRVCDIQPTPGDGGRFLFDKIVHRGDVL